MDRREFIIGAAALAGGCRLTDCGCAAVERARKIAESGVRDGAFFGAAFARSDRGPDGFVGWQGATPETGAVDGLTRFEVASVTKTVTAMIAARLVAQGRLDLFAPFTDYYADHVLAGTDHGIRVFELATHTSALGGFADARFSPDPGVSGGREGFLDGLRTCRPYAAPRKRVHYNCMNFCILAEICHRITGLSLAEMGRTMVFEPLGMTMSAWWPQRDDGHLAHLPLRQQDDLPRKTGTVSDPPALYSGIPTGNAGLYTSLHDLRLFTADILRCATFEPKAYELLYTPLVDLEGVRRSFGWNMDAAGRPKGLSERTIYHTGFTGHTVCVDPENDFAGVVMTVRTGDAAASARLRNEILTALAGKEAE